MKAFWLRFENVTVTNPFPDAPSNFGEFTIDDGTGGVRWTIAPAHSVAIWIQPSIER
ncbi:MAG: hypothetical protein R3C26_20645 [Calditrichia bacterium]